MECFIYPVPVIAVFTKYDQFRLNVEMNLEDSGCLDWESAAPAEVEKIFREHYQHHLPVETPHFVRLEGKILEGSSAFMC